jgi:putative ABC transport system substrate-binding protein
MRASPIPIVFNSGADPIGTGLVANFDRPGGNLTGVFTLVRALTAKNFGLLHELVPKATGFALLSGHVLGDRQAQTDAAEAAARLRLQTQMLAADTDGELDEAFATLDRERIGGLVVVTSPFFVTRASQIAALAARHRMPAIYGRREYAEAGGLMSYGYDVAASYRQMGNYAGRILKGEKPGDLPVVQPTKYELVINLRTAKALGIEVPSTLLALADEVIE